MKKNGKPSKKILRSPSVSNRHSDYLLLMKAVGQVLRNTDKLHDEHLLILKRLDDLHKEHLLILKKLDEPPAQAANLGITFGEPTNKQGEIKP